VSAEIPPPPATVAYRLPRSAYLVVLFLTFGVIPLAFTSDGTEGSRAGISVRTMLIIVPIAAAVFIARSATIVDAAGIRVRALLGTRRLSWGELRGLSVNGRSVYAVCGDGLVRLPCVRVANLAELARASAGRLPQLDEPTLKFAPARRRR
jgi:hypothetical protein